MLKKLNSKGFAKLDQKITSFVFLGFLAIGGGFIGGYFAYINTDDEDTNSSQTIVSEQQDLISKIVEDAGQSVVSINVQSSEIGQTFSGPREFTARSAGTGFIISDDGYVVTNRHVIPAGEPKISITLSNGTTLDDVSVVGRTAASDPLDIAFLKINDAEDNTLNPIDIGNSSNVVVGEGVVAIGNALGQFQNTVTSGIISGFGRDIAAGTEFDQDNLVNLFQTDAAINEGNSGGPLMNFDGQVIGITTAIAGGDAQNIGFAIPINDIRGLIKSVLESGELKRPFLGVRFIDLTDDIAAEEGLSVNRGAYLIASEGQIAVVSGSAAEKAGLEDKDVIIKVDGKDVDEQNSLNSLLGQHSAGDEVKLTVIRGDQEIELTATLDLFED